MRGKTTEFFLNRTTPISGRATGASSICQAMQRGSITPDASSFIINITIFPHAFVYFTHPMSSRMSSTFCFFMKFSMPSAISTVAYGL